MYRRRHILGNYHSEVHPWNIEQIIFHRGTEKTYGSAVDVTAKIMARGQPAIWSGLLATPFVASGGYVWIAGDNVAVPSIVGVPFLVFGLFVFIFGAYIHFVAAPTPPTMREGEEIIESRKPSQRAAIAKTSVGFLLLFIAGYFLFLTFSPYVYPTVAFLVGLYFLSTGLYAYWTNTLTTYYVTNRRLIKEYRFISLVRQELPFEKVRGVQERKSLWETLAGLGNVHVASGGGQSLEVTIRNIPASTDFADEIRDLL